MKTKLLFLLIVINYSAFAQSPITTFYGADNSSFAIVTSANALDHSASGANQTWNFNQLISLGSSVHTYVAPTATEASTYPGTTTVVVTTSTTGSTVSTGKLFTKNVANEVSITGLNGADLDANFTTNNATLSVFPMNYGFSNNDTNVAGNYTYQTYSGTFSGTLATTVDAYGTLTLNDPGNGAYSGNVTRLKTVLNLSMNYGFFTNIGTVTQTSYSYYDGTVTSNNPILRSVTTAAVVPLLSINQSDTSIEKFGTTTFSVSENSLDSIWIKNPIENNLEINSFSPIENATITIYDIQGKTIFRTVNETINGTLIIPASLNKGIYLLNINTETGSITKKIMKN